jgi:hypothetical protein
MLTSLMLAPIANRTYVVNGNTYVSDANGIVANILNSTDQASLQAAGLMIINPPPTNLLGKLLSANFNITTDQAIGMLISVKYRITKITVENTTVNGMSTAAGGFYTGASKTGTTIVAAGQVYTGLTNAATALDLTLAAPNAVLAAGTALYLSLTTPQGAAALADVYVWGDTYT